MVSSSSATNRSRRSLSRARKDAVKTFRAALFTGTQTHRPIFQGQDGAEMGTNPTRTRRSAMRPRPPASTQSDPLLRSPQEAIAEDADPPGPRRYLQTEAAASAVISSARPDARRPLTRDDAWRTARCSGRLRTIAHREAAAPPSLPSASCSPSETLRRTAPSRSRGVFGKGASRTGSVRTVETALLVAIVDREGAGRGRPPHERTKPARRRAASFVYPCPPVRNVRNAYKGFEAAFHKRIVRSSTRRGSRRGPGLNADSSPWSDRPRRESLEDDRTRGSRRWQAGPASSGSPGTPRSSCTHLVCTGTKAGRHLRGSVARAPRGNRGTGAHTRDHEAEVGAARRRPAASAR